jgi:hypothetical protein
MQQGGAGAWGGGSSAEGGGAGLGRGGSSAEGRGKIVKKIIIMNLVKRDVSENVHKKCL